MCGIAGILSLNGVSVDPAAVGRMSDAEAHRGPDGEGVVFFDRRDGVSRMQRFDARAPMLSTPDIVVALAHRRLAIIDLSDSGAQPMADRSERCWITFNGEIFNYLELRAELIAVGHTFHTNSDTEVILQAYLEWGSDCVHHLNGMFAFALWDTSARRLFCARDRLGVKPFYYSCYKGRLLFASEPKAILAGLDERPTPNVGAMEDYLTFSYGLSDQTMFQGIHRLPPGTWLTVDGSGTKTHKYWNPSFDPDPNDSRSDDAVAEELRGLLHDSLRLQVRSDVPIGAHLSGGIDSSTVCCLAAAHVPRLLTFTARFGEGGFFDETPYARAVARHIGSDHHEIVPKRSDLADLLPKILYHLDEPVEAASIFGKYHVAEIVSRSVKVVLGGQGGDELFGGYDWYVKNLFTATSFGSRGALGAGGVRAFMVGTLRRESLKRLLKSLWKNLGDADLSRIFCRNWSRLSPQQASRIFQPEIRNGCRSSAERFLEAYDGLSARRGGDRMFKFDVQHYLESLLTSEDRLSMAFSVESRVPLLDHRIAEFAGRLGFERKAVPGRSKQVLRKAVQGIVPSEVLDRRDKRGFPTPIGAWLRDPRLNLVQSMVLSDNSFARTYFDLPYVRRLMKSPTLLSTDWSERLWRVLNLSVWGQVFHLG